MLDHAAVDSSSQCLSSTTMIPVGPATPTRCRRRFAEPLGAEAGIEAFDRCRRRHGDAGYVGDEKEPGDLLRCHRRDQSGQRAAGARRPRFSLSPPIDAAGGRRERTALALVGLGADDTHSRRRRRGPRRLPQACLADARLADELDDPSGSDRGQQVVLFGRPADDADVDRPSERVVSERAH